MAGLGHLVANQPAAAAGDPEGVHQMRIAIRRLRTALVLFETHLEPHTTQRFEAELKRLGRVLGEARDWDVFCLETVPEALDDVPECQLGASAAAGRRESSAKRPIAGSRRRSEGRPSPASSWAWRHGSKTGRANPALLGDKRMRRRLAKLAPELLDRLAGKVAKRGKRIGRRSDEELHALRKSLKKLRYGVDDLAGLYGRKAVKAVPARVQGAAGAARQDERRRRGGRAGARAERGRRLRPRSRRRCPRAMEREAAKQGLAPPLRRLDNVPKDVPVLGLSASHSRVKVACRSCVRNQRAAARLAFGELKGLAMRGRDSSHRSDCPGVSVR